MTFHFRSPFSILAMVARVFRVFLLCIEGQTLYKVFVAKMDA